MLDWRLELEWADEVNEYLEVSNYTDPRELRGHAGYGCTMEHDLMTVLQPENMAA